MDTGERADRVRQVIGIFDGADKLLGAIDDITTSGIDRARLSLLAGEEAVEAKLGDRFERIEDLAEDPDAPRMAFIEPEDVSNAQSVTVGGLTYVGAVAAAGAVVASGGALLPAVGAAVAAGGGGAAVGGVLARMIGQRYDDYLSQQLDKGGLLLWVTASDATDAEQIAARLAQHTPHKVIHTDIPVGHTDQ